MGKPEGKIAWIAGGSSGIRSVTAKPFVEDDAYVFITEHREGPARPSEGFDCGATVHESNVFILLGIALSEKQIPRFVGNVSS